MKKIMTIAFAAVSLAACNAGTDNKTTGTSDEKTEVTTTSTTTNTAYAPAEGDVSRRDGKVMVMRNGQWVEADTDITLDNGTVVNRSGRVSRDGKEIELNDGEVVNKTGDFFDRSGKAIENAWEKTKEGAKEVGKDVGEAAKKAGDKLKDAVDNDDNNR